MSKLAGVIAVGLMSCMLPAVAASYKIDPMHTNARFSVDHFATSSNVGGFYNLTGEVQYDPQAKTGAVDITIPLKNLNTGRDVFNTHLRSKEFFNADQFPSMRFVSNRWVFNKNGKVLVLHGQLTMMGQTHPLVLKATKFNCYNSPVSKSQVCGGDFEGVIDRSLWGFNKYLQEIPASRYVKLSIEVEAAKH